MEQDQRIKRLNGYVYFFFFFPRESEFEMQASRFLVFFFIDSICKRVEWGPTSQTGPRNQASVRDSNERKNGRDEDVKSADGIAVYFWSS